MEHIKITKIVVKKNQEYTEEKQRTIKSKVADPSGRAVLGVGLRPSACWDRGFELADPSGRAV
jgi:hypothetical protein